MRPASRALLAALVVALGPRSLVAQDPVADSMAAFTAAVPVMEAWLALLDAERYDDTWAGASEAFRQAVTIDRWRADAAAARRPFAPFGQRELQLRRYATELPGAPPGRYVIIIYRTAVRDGGQVIETVVATAAPDGRWQVGGYFVRAE